MQRIWDYIVMNHSGAYTQMANSLHDTTGYIVALDTALTDGSINV
jgi:hypothetical protein